MSRLQSEPARFQRTGGGGCCRRNSGRGVSPRRGPQLRFRPGATLAMGSPVAAHRSGAELVVQPVLMYLIQEPKDETSYRNWGSVHTAPTAAREAERIQGELKALSAAAGFPLRVLPLVCVSTPEQARAVHQGKHDVVLIYPASGSSELLTACFATQPHQDTLVFARHRNGPLYYWYEGLSTRFLRSGSDQEVARNSADNHGPVTVHDVVIDDPDELVWKLRALHGLKNLIGQRIVALGGPMGKYDPDAPGLRASGTGSRSSTSTMTNSPGAWPAPGPTAARLPGRKDGPTDTSRFLAPRWSRPASSWSTHSCCTNYSRSFCATMTPLPSRSRSAWSRPCRSPRRPPACRSRGSTTRA